MANGRSYATHALQVFAGVRGITLFFDLGASRGESLNSIDRLFCVDLQRLIAEEGPQIGLLEIGQQCLAVSAAVGGDVFTSLPEMAMTCGTHDRRKRVLPSRTAK